MRYDAVCPQTNMQRLIEFDRNALLTLENYGGYNNCFLAVFRLADFFGSFSDNAENITLGG